MEYTRSIKLDINPSGLPPVIRIKQGDGFARFIEITLMKDNEAWTPESGVVFYFRCEKPDGAAVVTDSVTNYEDLGRKMVTVSGNVVRIELVEQVDAAAGRCKCDLCMKKNEQILSTIPFVLDVIAYPNVTSGIESSSEFKALIDAVATVSEAVGEAEEAVTIAETAVTAANNAVTAANTAVSTASTAAARANTAASSAEAAAENAEEAAGLVEGMTASAENLSTGAPASVTVERIPGHGGASDHYNLDFGIPTGVGISGATTSYGISSSQNVLPSTWVSSVTDITVPADEWLWAKIVISYDDNRPSETVYLKSQRGSLGPAGVAVQNSSPVSGELLWVDPDETNTIVVPEIDDSTVSTVNTFSSSKIDSLVGDGSLSQYFTATDLTEAVNELMDDIQSGGGGGGTSDYTELSNKPSINSVTLSGNKTASDLGLGTYTKPSGGIPVSDINSTGLDQAIASWFGNNFPIYRQDFTEYLTPTLKGTTSSASIERFVIGNLSIIRVSIVMSGTNVIQGQPLTDTGVNLGIGYHSGPAVGQLASTNYTGAARIGSSASDGVLYCIIDGSAVYRTLRGIAVGWIEDEQGS